MLNLDVVLLSRDHMELLELPYDCFWETKDLWELF